MKTPRRAFVALVAGLALSACAGPGAGPATPATTGATPVTSQPSPDPSSVPSDPTPTGKGGPSVPPPARDTLTGVVEAGVEPGCLLLGGKLLVGGPRDVLEPGTRVVVTGHLQPGLMTTCQQGTPFVVASARRA